MSALDLSALKVPLFRSNLYQTLTDLSLGMYSIPFHTTNKISDYDSVRNASIAAYASIPGNEPGDPLKAVNAIYDIVKGKGVAEGKTWPWCLLLGNDAEKDLNSRWKQVLLVVSSVDAVFLMRLKPLAA